MVTAVAGWPHHCLSSLCVCVCVSVFLADDVIELLLQLLLLLGRHGDRYR